MALLQVRDLPDHIHRMLTEEARRERRSVSQQAVAVLARGLQTDADPQARRRRALLRASKIDPKPAERLDFGKMIREDRDR